MDETALDALQRLTFGYFRHEANPANGLVRDSTRADAHASIAAVGFALACYPIGVERAFITRADAVQRTLTTLRFFHESEQSDAPTATGFRGFYYHFLHMDSGRRARRCELSTIDTTILLAGMLAARTYYVADDADEREIRQLADALYARVEWDWALDGGDTVAMGWKPAGGFLPYRWEGYTEALLLYVLALASPTHPIPPASYAAQCRRYAWRRIYGVDLLHAGPLFIHQLSHSFIDLRAIQDAFMREKGSDYFENSIRATRMQQQYAIRNPRRHAGYGEHCWGLTASDGPGPMTLEVNGVRRRVRDYVARGVPFGPDDGTIAPWAAVASLPFAPDVVLPTLAHLAASYPDLLGEYGFRSSFNPGVPARSGHAGAWISDRYFGVDQGPSVMMLENYRSGSCWWLMRQCPYVVDGLRAAGFSGGWLSAGE